MVEIYDKDTGHYIGEIPQVTHTYGVVGLMNEHQLAIGETSYGGIDSLQTQDGVFFYYLLFYVNSRLLLIMKL
jgi:hypothetical protein